MPKKKLVFATHNTNKLAEIQQLLGESFEVISLTDLNFFDEIDETENTLEGNAKLKSSAIHQRFSCNVFSDDTGLEVLALNDEPGVLSARYAGAERNNQANMDLLLNRLSSFADKRAQFRTAISLFWEQEHYLFEGVVSGKIISDIRGAHGFGYDPIFVPDGYDKTFAEMSSTEKNKISHRGQAVSKMVSFLKERN